MNDMAARIGDASSEIDDPFFATPAISDGATAQFLLDANGMICGWSREAEMMYAYTAGEVLGQPLSIILSMIDTEQSLQAAAQRLQIAQVESYEEYGQFIGKGGKRLQAKILIAALHGLNGTLLGFSVTSVLCAPAEEATPTAGRELARMIVEHALDHAIFTLDLNGIVTSWNKGAERVKGYTAREIVGQHFSRLYLQEDIERGAPQQELACALRDGRHECEGWRLRRDGGLLWVNDVLTPLYEGQQCCGFSKIGRDFTQRRRDAEALWRSEERFRLIVDGVRDYAIFMLDSQGVVDSWNNGAVRIKGYQDHEIIGRHFSCFYPREEVEAGRPEAALRQAQQEGCFEDQGWRIRKDGSKFWAHVFITALRDPQGRLCGYSKITRDMSQYREEQESLQRAYAQLDLLVLDRTVALALEIEQRKQVEAELSREKERLQVTLHSIGDAVITTDMAGAIAYMNPAAQAMTGWASGEAVGLPIALVFNIVSRNERRILENPVDIVLQTGKPASQTSNTLLIRKDGLEYAIEDSAAPILNQHGEVVGVVMVFHDVSQAQVMAEKMAYQATHDPLTGLANRSEFERLLERAIGNGRAEGKPYALAYLDLDQFKVVNDTCGHLAGDMLLQQLSALLQERLRSTDTLARLGGDEFGVLLEGCAPEAALRIAESLRQTVSEFRFVWQDKHFQIGVSIGLVSFANGEMGLVDTMIVADAACYAAKDQGRNRIHVYRADDHDILQKHGEMDWLGRIHSAIEEQRLLLYAQEIIGIAKQSKAEHPGGKHPDEYRHIELLIRMCDETGQIVLPMAFIPAAERYNLMPYIDRWVIRTAFAHYAEHVEQPQLIRYAINLSGSSLNDGSLLDYIREQFSLYQIPPAAICFEITETAAIANLAHATTLIREARKMGCQFALDDFGSGMSSFAYLKHLPVDYLKIDGGFVKEMVNDPTDCAMVEAINNIGHVMGLQTIAEFVENDATLAKLQHMGVDFVQGFAIGHPYPLHP